MHTIRSIGMICGRCKECMESEKNCLKAAQSSYVDSRVCVRVGNDMNEWFPVNVRLSAIAAECEW